MHVTVLGATGGAGRAIVEELATRGHAVTAASRRATRHGWPDCVRTVDLDLTDRAAARAAVAGTDVVVMAVNVPYAAWATELGPLVETALDAAADADARLVMVDNLYAYGSPGTAISDGTPEAATTRKGLIRRDLGRRLLAAHRDGRARVTIGRFSDYYGAGATMSLVYMLGVRRILAGRRPQAFVAADEPHTFAYLPDAARGFATLVERPEADGRSWILPAAPAVTQRGLYRLLTAATGQPARLGRVTPAMLWVAGLVDPRLREAREVVAQFDRPFVTQADDFTAAFGHIELTPHDRALAQTLAGFRRQRTAAEVTPAEVTA